MRMLVRFAAPKEAPMVSFDSGVFASRLTRTLMAILDSLNAARRYS